MLDWEKCVKKNEGIKFEYLSNSRNEFIDVDDLDDNHSKNIMKLILREGKDKLFRLTYYQDGKAVGGEFIKVHLEKAV